MGPALVQPCHQSVAGSGGSSAERVLAPLSDLKQSQGEIYICRVVRMGLDGASEFCGTSLKHSSAAALDFLSAVGRVGEEAAHLLQYSDTGSQAQIGGCHLAHPAPDGAIGQKSGR